MKDFHGLRKLMDWPLLVGVMFGAGGVIFLVYPPAPGWGSHVFWGDIAGWAGAIASFGAAVVALAIALRDSRQREMDSRAHAAVVAGALYLPIFTLRTQARAGARLFGDCCSAEDDEECVGKFLGASKALKKMDARRLTEMTDRLVYFPAGIARKLAALPPIVESVAFMADRGYAAYANEHHDIGKLRERAKLISSQLALIRDTCAEMLEKYGPEWN